MAALFSLALCNTGCFVSARVLGQIESGFLLHLLEITMAIQTFESLSTFLLNLMDFCRCLQQSFNPWHSYTGLKFDKIQAIWRGFWSSETLRPNFRPNLDPFQTHLDHFWPQNSPKNGRFARERSNSKSEGRISKVDFPFQLAEGVTTQKTARR